MKRNLLFIAYRDGEFGDDLAYVLDLAKTLDRGIAILLIRKSRLAKRFENLMTAITFAEANEHATAREFTKASEDEDAEALELALGDRCRLAGISAQIYSTLSDITTALKDFLKTNGNVDMVLLSPAVTGGGSFSSRQLSNIVRAAARPVITLAKHAEVA